MAEPPKAVESFSELNLGSDIKKALDKMGYIKPTPIQAMAIPAALQGRDIFGQARTGTGKTAAFAIPVLEGLNDRRPRYPKALILAPTRELATQIRDEMRKIGEFKKTRVMAVVGGRSVEDQVRKLKKGAHVVVGTPGRVIDLSNRGVLSLDHVEFAVLDEADEMLDMGFVDDVEDILRRLPEERQTFLFSATSEDKVFQIAFNHMVNPKIVRVKQSEADKAKIKELFHMVHPSERMEALFEAIKQESEGQTLVFCRTKREVDSVAERLLAKGLSVEAIHGDFKQVRRDKVMKNFKDGKTEILVATDVAARGIHVENITTVINYSLPDDPTVYVHRIGRTGRVGKTGVAISLYTIDQKYTLNDYRTRASAAFEAGAY